MTAATPGRERSDAAINDLWERRTTGDASARDALIIHYAPLVKFVAGRIGAGLPSVVESQDLVSYGMFGLIGAVDRFDPRIGASFEGYAVQRIRGAILDGLRGLDWVPRTVRSRARRIQDGLAELEHRLQRTPTEHELAAHLEMEVGRLRHALGEVAAGGLIALDDLSIDRGPTLREVLVDPDAEVPGGALEAAELRAALLTAIRGLPERERFVVTLYYFEAMTLAQIGDVLGVTESRVSQIHAKAVLSLRNRLTRAIHPV